MGPSSLLTARWDGMAGSTYVVGGRDGGMDLLALFDLSPNKMDLSSLLLSNIRIKKMAVFSIKNLEMSASTDSFTICDTYVN